MERKSSCSVKLMKRLSVQRVWIMSTDGTKHSHVQQAVRQRKVSMCVYVIRLYILFCTSIKQSVFLLSLKVEAESGSSSG